MSRTCIEMSGGVENWANCSVIDCPNKATLWLGTGKCFPHSIGANLGEWAAALKSGHRARHDCMLAHGAQELVDDELARGIMCDYRAEPPHA